MFNGQDIYFKKLPPPNHCTSPSKKRDQFQPFPNNTDCRSKQITMLHGLWSSYCLYEDKVRGSFVDNIKLSTGVTYLHLKFYLLVWIFVCNMRLHLNSLYMYRRIYKNIIRSPRAEILGKCTMTNIVQLEFVIALYREHEARKIVLLLLLLWRRRRRRSSITYKNMYLIWRLNR